MRRRDVTALLFSTFGLAGCWGNTYTWNQKLTVNVNTPDGIKSGSAVTQVTAKVGGQSLLSQAVVSYKVTGEATFVKLGIGKFIFALLSNGGDYEPTEYWAAKAFHQQLVEDFGYGTEEKLAELFEKFQTFRGSKTLALADYPLLVTFTDTSDPKSVAEMKPMKLADRFGAGYSLKSITLEITDEAVTKVAVEKVLVWLSQYPEPPLCQPTSGTDFSFCATNVHHGDFTRR